MEGDTALMLPLLARTHASCVTPSGQETEEGRKGEQELEQPARLGLPRTLRSPDPPSSYGKCDPGTAAVLVVLSDLLVSSVTWSRGRP